MRGARWATESWWQLLMWAASSHSHLLLGSGGSLYEGHWMGHWELMVALDVSCLLSLSFTVGFLGFILWGVLDGPLRVDGSSWCELPPLTLRLWGFVLWGVPDGPQWVDGGSWCELPPLTLFYFRVLGILFMRGANTLLSFLLFTFYLV